MSGVHLAHTIFEYAYPSNLPRELYDSYSYR